MNQRSRSGVRGSLLLVALVSCGAEVAPSRAQLLVTVSTDAPVPELGDRLRLEVLDHAGNACSGCQLDLDVSAEGDWPVSFGVVVGDTTSPPAYVIARLYRADAVGPTGVPLDSAYIESLLVVTPPTGVQVASLTLPTACFDVPADVGSGKTCDPSTRQLSAPPTLPPPALTVDSWPAMSFATPHDVPSAMIAISGGAMLVGSTQAPYDDPNEQPVPERLVLISTFALDSREMTVGSVRSLIRSGALAAKFAPLEPSAPLTPGSACAYLGAADASADARPVNCVSFDAASAICTALGKRLPTEAEWEFAARNRVSRTTYPWGADPDVCSFAAVGLGRNVAEVIQNEEEDQACRSNGAPFGPIVGGDPHDVTSLGVHDMAGNVSEWVADLFQRYDGTYWSSGAPALVDPVANGTSAGFDGEHSVRGGNWSDPPAFANASVRQALVAAASSPYVGFRCARTL